ncbi:hypothetical protein ACHAWF_012193 [Thalassiosira exigua]
MNHGPRNQAWGWCVASALAGSALTLLAIELRRKILCAQNNRGEATAGHNTTKCVSNEGDEAAGFSHRYVPARKGDDNDNGGANGERRPSRNDAVNDTGSSSSLRRRPRPSFSGSFNEVDGEMRNSLGSLRRSTLSETSITNVVVLPDQGMSDDKAVVQARTFVDHVLSKLTTLEECKMLLHRTRAVSALAPRLMAAPDEQSCYELASRLLVPLFCVDRCSYVLLKDAEHIIVKGIAVKKRQHAMKMGLDAKKYGGVVKPLKNTMVGVCAETLEQQYCPRTKDSSFESQRMMYTVGINTILATPILVNGNKFAGAIVICMTAEDAFKEHDRILVQDIASMLGANIYAKRMRQAAESSNKVAREMLQSMIPAKVISTIEKFWDENSDEYQSRRSVPSISRDSINDLSHYSPDDLDASSRMNSDEKAPKLLRCQSVKEKINFLNHINTSDNASESNAGVIVDTSSMEIGSLHRALYAENVENAVIIFTDIVGFSKMALDMKPMDVLNMLQALFSRFDSLCDKHGITKLETVGDAYLCTANLYDEDQFNGDVRSAALSALNMAKDMAIEAQEIMMPGLKKMEIRVGMHVGEVTCGVLGERLPK